MKYYIPKHPIRCGDCGELVDCYVEEYLYLISKGFSPEKALDEMGIFRICTRNKFFNPSNSYLEVENKLLVDGYIDYSPGLKPDKNSILVESNFGKDIRTEEFEGIQENDFDPLDKYPVEIGIPTIHPYDFPDSKIMIHVGGNKYSQKIPGRKFLCN